MSPKKINSQTKNSISISQYKFHLKIPHNPPLQENNKNKNA